MQVKLAVLRRPRTQALLDGKVKLAGQSVHWCATSNPLGWQLAPGEKSRDLAAGDWDGGEMSISSFMQAKSRGAPIVALPIFLKRGLVQRSLFCSANSPLRAPEQLAGKKVALVGYASSMAVWMRGILFDGYGLDPASCQWFALGGSSDVTPSMRLPDEFFGANIPAWEELDGYEHELDRREAFLVSLLSEGKLDAVVSFQARIDDRRIRPLFDENGLWSDAINSRIYPINHLFVVKAELLSVHPQLVRDLVSLFDQARRLWVDYLPAPARDLAESEMVNLGFDPFANRLGEIETRTLEHFVGCLLRERLISRRLDVGDLFHPDK